MREFFYIVVIVVLAVLGYWLCLAGGLKALTGGM